MEDESPSILEITRHGDGACCSVFFVLNDPKPRRNGRVEVEKGGEEDDCFEIGERKLERGIAIVDGSFCDRDEGMVCKLEKMMQ